MRRITSIRVESSLFYWNAAGEKLMCLLAKMRFFLSINPHLQQTYKHKYVSMYRTILLATTKADRKAEKTFLIINLMWFLHKIKRNRIFLLHFSCTFWCELSRFFAFFRAFFSFLIEWCKIYDVSLSDFYVFSSRHLFSQRSLQEQKNESRTDIKIIKFVNSHKLTGILFFSSFSDRIFFFYVTIRVRIFLLFLKEPERKRKLKFSYCCILWWKI